MPQAVTATPPATSTSSVASSAAQLRHRLREEHGLEVDGDTARYLVRRLDAGDEEILSFPAADRDGGRWAFRVLPAEDLRKPH